MSDDVSITHPGPKGIGGWLLLYVVLTAISIVAVLVQTGKDVLFVLNQPTLILAESFIALLCVAWYGLYAVMLYRLVQRRAGAVAGIKKMIAGTALLNTVFPFLFSLALVLTVPGSNLAVILGAAYSAETLGGIFGTCVMAAIWYRYFCVSERVRNTWSDMGEDVR